MVEKHQLLVLADLRFGLILLAFFVGEMIEVVIDFGKYGLWLGKLVVGIKFMGREVNNLALLILHMILWHYFHHS